MAEVDTLSAKTNLAVQEAAELRIDVPAPKQELITLQTANVEQTSAIQTRMAEIDVSNTQSIIKFGMVTTIRGFDISSIDPDRQGFFARIWAWVMGKSASTADYIAQYEQVRGQIDRIQDELLTHETKLLKDIKFLDKLYDSSLDFYDELALYIAAGEAKLVELDTTVIPAKEAEVKAAPQQDGVVKAQELRDLRAARDDLERRVHDLKLTRQVTMQSLPSIRLVQENDKSLVNKINSTLVNTVPLWQTQLAQAVTIQRSRDAAGTVGEATDLTNELLTKNADNLQMANREVREQMERGVFDIESVKRRKRARHDGGRTQAHAVFGEIAPRWCGRQCWHGRRVKRSVGHGMRAAAGIIAGALCLGACAPTNFGSTLPAFPIGPRATSLGSAPSAIIPERIPGFVAALPRPEPSYSQPPRRGGRDLEMGEPNHLPAGQCWAK